MHLDMDAFFASVEEAVNPRLRGRPIAVVGSAKRTVVTTASYEARKRGVRTGMTRGEARRLCPEIIFVAGDNRKYTDTSRRILSIVESFSPVVEVYSIDEVFVDISGTEKLFGPPHHLALLLKKRIRSEVGLAATIGIASNKLLAKLASGMGKPDGLVVLGDIEAARILEGLPVGELWGIGPKLAAHLGAMKIKTCGQLGRAPAGLLRRRFGIIGERLKLMGRGLYPEPVTPESAEPKSIGHSMTLPEDVSPGRELERYMLRLAEMVGARARREGFKARRVGLTVRYRDFYTFHRQATSRTATSETRAIYRRARAILSSIRLAAPVRLLGVTLSALERGPRQLPLFEGDDRRERAAAAMDAVNGRFGPWTITWASLLEGREMPGVISPAWRPSGTRNIDVP